MKEGVETDPKNGVSVCCIPVNFKNQIFSDFVIWMCIVKLVIREDSERK